MHCQSKYDIITSSTTADEPQVIEFRDLILHDRRAVPEFRTIVLIISGTNRNCSTIHYVAEGDYLEGNRKSLVGAPVRRKFRAEKVRTAGSYKFVGMF